MKSKAAEFSSGAATSESNADDNGAKTRETPSAPSKSPDPDKSKKPANTLSNTTTSSTVQALKRFAPANQTSQSKPLQPVQSSNEMLRDLLAKLTNRDSSAASGRPRPNAANSKRNILAPPPNFPPLPQYPTTPYPPYGFDPLRATNPFLHGRNQPDYRVGGNLFLPVPRDPYATPYPPPRAARSASSDATARLRASASSDFSVRKVESQIESLSFDMFCRCHQPDFEVSNPKLSVATARLHLLRIWSAMPPSDKQPYTDISARKIFYRVPNIPNLSARSPYEEAQPNFDTLAIPPQYRFPVPVEKRSSSSKDTRMRPLRPEEATAKPLQAGDPTRGSGKKPDKAGDQKKSAKDAKVPEVEIDPAETPDSPNGTVPVTLPPTLDDDSQADGEKAKKPKVPPLVHNGVVAAQKLVNMSTTGMALMRLKPRRQRRSKSGKRRRSKHRMRDPFAPRRPWNAYAFFVSCNQELLKSQMPNKTQCERMRVMGQNWKSLPQEARQIYKDLELKDKTRFANERMRYEALKRANIQPLSSFDLGVGVLGDTQQSIVPLTYPKIPSEDDEKSPPGKRRRSANAR